MKKLIIFLSLIAIFLFASCLNVSKPIKEVAPLEEAEEKIIEPIEKTAEVEIEEDIVEEFYVGQTIIAKGVFELTIHSVENYKAKNKYTEPEEGFRLVAFDVELKNTRNEPLGYGFGAYKAQDSDRYVYGRGYHDSKLPTFSIGELASGQIHRAWVTVAVKEDAEIVAIIAQPLYKSPPLTIKLHEPLKP